MVGIGPYEDSEQGAGVSDTAVLIDSEKLGEPLWFVLDEKKFVYDDDVPCYYPEELRWLQWKSKEELKRIHETKKVWPESRVRE